MGVVVSSAWRFSSCKRNKSSNRRSNRATRKRIRRVIQMVISVVLVAGKETEVLRKNEMHEVDNTPQSFTPLWLTVQEQAKKLFPAGWRFVPKKNRFGFGFIQNAEQTATIELRRIDETEVGVDKK